MKYLNIDWQIEKWSLVCTHWILYGFAIMLYTLLPYYTSWLQSPFPDFPLTLQEGLFVALILNSFWILCARTGPGVWSQSRAYSTLQAGIKVITALASGTVRFSLTPTEKVSLLLYGVKLFFVPIMLIFFAENLAAVLAVYPYLSWSTLFDSPIFVYATFFPALLSGMLLIDTAFFLVGYLVESPRLKNEVRSVDTTALGWLSVMMCYPPFNALTEQIIGWSTADFSDFGSPSINLIAGTVALLAMSVYVWATVSLGWKCSNLTNRGIVSHGAYAYVRHPAYASKNIAWWIMSIPAVISSLFGSAGLTVVSVTDYHGMVFVGEILNRFAPLLSVLAWSGIYYVRALTEERHLMQDVAYREYMRQVPARFFPRFF